MTTLDVQAAAALHQAGDLDQAEAAYVRLLEIPGPERAVVLQLLALVRVQQGRLAAALEAYDALASDGLADAAAHQARGDCLEALGRSLAALAAYDDALALAPGRVAAHTNRALALISLNRFNEAATACDAALALTPEDAAVWANRSAALRGATRLEEALTSAEQALTLRPGFVDALNARGLAQAALNDFEGAIASYDAALAAVPAHRDALNNAGVTLTALRRFDEARARHVAALALDPSFAEAEYNLGLLALRQGDDAGWRGYEARWRRRGQPGPAYPDATLWRGERDIAGQTILLHAEQGLGDTLQFVRYAAAVKALGAQVALQVQPSLVRLLASLEGVDTVLAEASAPPAFHRHIPLMSLPQVFGRYGGRPYLHADPGAVSAWRDRLPADRLKVGLAWSGNPAHGDDRNRSLPFTALAPLLGRNAAFVSLQATVRDADVPALHASAVLPWPAQMRDFADTAALVQALDLVITVDTAVAHLAGGLGAPTWVLLPRFPDWRWGEGRADTPWYPTLSLFRQTAFGLWDDVLAEVAEALDARIRDDRAHMSPSPA